MEKWDAYDRFRNKLGFQIVRDEPIPAGVRHIVAHMIYYNSKGELLLQRRAETKSLAPGAWAFTGGSALAGETTRDACVRETEEELGFTPNMSEAELIISHSGKDFFADVYLIKTDISVDGLSLQPEEVAEARWVSRAEFVQLISEPGRFWKYRYTDMALRHLDEMGYIR